MPVVVPVGLVPVPGVIVSGVVIIAVSVVMGGGAGAGAGIGVVSSTGCTLSSSPWRVQAAAPTTATAARTVRNERFIRHLFETV